MLHLARKASILRRIPRADTEIPAEIREMINFPLKLKRWIWICWVNMNPEGVAQGVGPFTHGSAGIPT